jgi:hypothetical protein
MTHHLLVLLTTTTLLVTSGCVLDPGPETWTPIELALGGDSKKDVYGLRLNLPGVNRSRNVHGLDVGIFNVVDQHAGPFQVGVLANFAKLSSGGLQVAGVINRVGRRSKSGSMEPGDDMVGLQVAGLANMGNIYGLQISLLQNGVNVLTPEGQTEDKFPGFLYGLQIAAANVATDANGIQVGLVLNESEILTGLQVAGFWSHTKQGSGAQVGLLNEADSFSGVQVGLVNVSKKGVSGLQLGLWNYNPKGFLSHFPIFNFGWD